MTSAKAETTAPFSLAGKRVFIAGHRGMVGSAICRRLAIEGCEVLTATRAELDLTSQAAVQAWMQENQPQVVFLAAAKVGGIFANDAYPAEFLYENLMIEANIIHAAYQASVEKLVFLGSSCIYPKHAAQPMTEDALLTGPLEPTNEWYAIAKIAGIKLCQAYRKQYGADFISAMPTNLYGPGDNYHPENSHVIPALIRKFVSAAETSDPSVTVWGSGTPLREFMHADDCADALVFLAQNYSGHEHVNVSSGQEITIAGLAEMIGSITGFNGQIEQNASKPDGTPRKLMDDTTLKALGWQARIPLADGLQRTIDDVRAQNLL